MGHLGAFGLNMVEFLFHCLGVGDSWLFDLWFAGNTLFVGKSLLLNSLNYFKTIFGPSVATGFSSANRVFSELFWLDFGGWIGFKLMLWHWRARATHWLELRNSEGHDGDTWWHQKWWLHHGGLDLDPTIVSIHVTLKIPWISAGKRVP